MPADPADPYLPKTPRARRASAIWWVGVAVLYIALGVAFPPLFLLGFQESLIFVFVVTLIGAWVIRRFK